MKKMISILAGIFTLLAVFAAYTSAASKPTFSITPSSPTYKHVMTNYSTYNKYTKQYYVLRSYLEELEKKGGGTLILNKGTYTIPNTLYVPSNVTIRFRNGVKLIKGKETGTSQFKAAKSIFQLVRPSRSSKTGVYGKYEGEKNISFIGEGTVTIDMKYFKDSIAIIAGHNQNLRIENIGFANMQSGHFIEMDATYKAVIKNNRFTGSLPSSNRIKEAINLDTPDKTTAGWSQKWSKFDKTPNKSVLIEGNRFLNLDRAIGTHKYSEGKFHDAVVIRKNTIDKTRRDAIGAMNWSNSVIEQNTIRNVGDGSGIYRAIIASGVKNPSFKNNTIENAARPVQFFPWKNSGPGSQYAVTYNTLSAENIKVLSTNKVKNTTETFIRINQKYNDFTTKNSIRVECSSY